MEITASCFWFLFTGSISVYTQGELVTNALTAGWNDVVHFLADYGNKVSGNPLLCVEIHYNYAYLFMHRIVLY